MIKLALVQLGEPDALPTRAHVDALHHRELAHGLRTGESLLQTGGLLRRQTAFGFGSTTRQHGRIEIACLRVENHAVLQAVFFVARFHNGVDNEFLIAVGKFWSDAIQGRREKREAKIGIAGADGGITLAVH